MKQLVALLVLLIMVVGAGCSHFDHEAREHNISDKSALWFDVNSNRRGAIAFRGVSTAKTGKRDWVYLAEPAPDSAKEIMDAFSAKVNYGKLGVEAQANLSDKIVQLAKRSQTIQFLRESMYRLSELWLNGAFTQAEMAKLYKQVLDTASAVALIELKDAEKGAAEAQKDLIEAQKNLVQDQIQKIIKAVAPDGKVDRKKLEIIIKSTGIDRNDKSKKAFLDEFDGKPAADLTKELGQYSYDAILGVMIKNITDIK